jgi:hypothetical protein
MSDPVAPDPVAPDPVAPDPFLTDSAIVNSVVAETPVAETPKDKMRGLAAYTQQYITLSPPSDIDLQLANNELNQALILYDAEAHKDRRNPWVAAPAGGKCTLGSGCTGKHHWSAVHSARHPLTWTVTRHYHYAVHILRLRGEDLKVYIERSLNLAQRAQFISMGTYMSLACERAGPMKRMQHMAIASSLQSSGLGSLLPTAKRTRHSSEQNV